MLGWPVLACWEPVGGHGRDEDGRPFQALGPVDRGEVDRVQHEVGFAVEALVGALGVVDDVDGQVAVVPEAPVLAAELLAGRVRVGPGSSPDGLVVDEQGGEPGEGAEPVHRQRVKRSQERTFSSSSSS